MKTLPAFALIALALLTAAPSHAAPKLSLDMNEFGEVTILKDGTALGTVISRMVDTSTGNWRYIRVPVQPQEGQRIEWTAKFPFSDGSVVDRKTIMEVKGSQLTIESSWPTDSPAAGFGMIVLNIPEETAQDLTVEAENKIIFRDLDKGAHPDTEGELVFRQTSTGDFLFNATSSNPRYSLVFHPEEKHRGLEFRIGGRQPRDQAISEETSLNAVFSFEE